MGFVLLGCEESQACCIEFRKAGHQAFSCDTQECSGGHPEWHFKMDIFTVIKGGWLQTQAGNWVFIEKWDLGIFFPPCTFLTVSANKWYKDQPPRKSGVLVGKERRDARESALCFVRDLMNCGIKRIAIENPIGVIGSRIFWYIGGENGVARWEIFPREMERGGRKPDQIIQPWMFGHGETKATCLWLTNLPKLYWSATSDLFNEATAVSGREQKVFKMPPGEDRSTLRSKTYPGIAAAFAKQWGPLLPK